MPWNREAARVLSVKIDLTGQECISPACRWGNVGFMAIAFAMPFRCICIAVGG